MPTYLDFIMAGIAFISLLAVIFISYTQGKQSKNIEDLTKTHIKQTDNIKTLTQEQVKQTIELKTTTKMTFILGDYYKKISSESITPILGTEIDLMAQNKPEGQQQINDKFLEAFRGDIKSADSITERLKTVVNRYQDAVYVLKVLNIEPDMIIDMQSTTIKRIYNMMVLKFEKPLVNLIKQKYGYDALDYLTFMRALKSNALLFQNFIDLNDKTREKYTDTVR